MESSTHAVVIEQLSFGYPPRGLQRPALDDVTLRIERNDFLGVIGPNGGGKTTLLKTMLGLLTPQRGTVRVFGRPPGEVRGRVGYVPQHTRIDLSAPANVLDVILMGRLARSSWGFRFGRSDREAARRALERVELADCAHRRFGTLSGGERQRVLIARALVADAGILLLDEPTAGVDIQMERGLIDLLHQLNADLPIVLVSHDISFVSTHLKRVACLNRRMTVHAAREISDEIVADMYDGSIRVVHHDYSCPLHDPGCAQGCEESG